MTAQQLKAKKLATLVEYIAERECEQRAFIKGGEHDEWVNLYPRDDDWFLVCVARRDLAAYRDDE